MTKNRSVVAQCKRSVIALSFVAVAVAVAAVDAVIIVVSVVIFVGIVKKGPSLANLHKV